MQIFVRGKTKKNENGFIMLRGLTSVLIVIFCMSAVSASLFAMSKGSYALLQSVKNEIEKQNNEVMKCLNQ